MLSSQIILDIMPKSIHVVRDFGHDQESRRSLRRRILEII
jgi:hypothetical protein